MRINKFTAAFLAIGWLASANAIVFVRPVVMLNKGIKITNGYVLIEHSPNQWNAVRSRLLSDPPAMSLADLVKAQPATTEPVITPVSVSVPVYRVQPSWIAPRPGTVYRKETPKFFSDKELELFLER